MSILQKILSYLPFGSDNKHRILAHNIYVGLVEDARNPETFTKCKVEDTVDGRFDIIVLHLSLFLRRMKQAKETVSGQTAEDLELLSQELVGVYNTDMDRNLREIGVGDMSVGKHVKKMAKAFYGRLLAYDEALNKFDDNNDQGLLRQSLTRNIYRGEVGEDALNEMVLYVVAYGKHLDSVSIDSLMMGEFPKYTNN